MPAHQFSTITPAARHVPDYSVEKDPHGNNVAVELPGKVQLGFVVDGVFVPVEERKAAGLLSDIEKVAKSGSSSSEG